MTKAYMSTLQYMSTLHPRGTPNAYAAERAEQEARAILAETEPYVQDGPDSNYEDTETMRAHGWEAETLAESLAAFIATDIR